MNKALARMASQLEPFVKVELPTRERFGNMLNHLMEHGDIEAACREADISPKAARLYRRQNPQAEDAFREALDIGTDAIEAELHRRAVTGILEPIFYKGRRVNTVRKKSDVLLMFLLKKRRPEYRDNYQQVEADEDATAIESPAEKIASRLDQLARRRGAK